jgi:hypothetical protein
VIPKANDYELACKPDKVRVVLQPANLRWKAAWPAAKLADTCGCLLPHFKLVCPQCAPPKIIDRWEGGNPYSLMR